MSLDLRTHFETVHAPIFLIDADPKTIRSYRETIAHWTKIIGQPPISSIRVEHLAKFKHDLFEGTPRQNIQRSLFPEIDLSLSARALAAPTVNKHLRNVMAMLNKAGPPGPRNRDALGIIGAVPWVRPLREPKRLPHCITTDDLAALYKVCPSIWWQTLITTAYTTAFRREALFSLEWQHLDLIDAIVHLPADNDKCNVERIKPLHPITVKHLKKLRQNTVDSQFVFPWPHTLKTFYKQWHELQDAARIADHFTLHDLKRTAGTRLAETSNNPWIVQQMLDHASINTSKSYINATDQLRSAVEKLPLPDSMKGFSE